MGIQGSPCKIKKKQIVDALKKYKGKVSYAAKSLDICYVTIMKKIREFDLVEFVDGLRTDSDESLLDMAEDTLAYAMANRKKELANALRSAFYVLNSKGRGRGWKNTHVAEINVNSLSDIEKWQQGRRTTRKSHESSV